MTHPLDDATASCLVLLNEEGRYSLWPAFLTVPAGWSVALAASDRDTCRRYLESHWLDCGRAAATP